MLGAMHRIRLSIVLALVVSIVALPTPCARAQGAQAPKRPDAQQLAPYVPTPQEVVDRMLQLAGVTKSDVVYDLGSGDGRIPITAAKMYGARGVGVDIDPQRIAESNANAKRAGVSHLVTFRLEDAMKTDLSEATVVTLYLLSSSNLKLRPILQKGLKPGARIVSHDFDMDDWKEDKKEEVTSDRTHTIYLWTIKKQ